MAEIAVFAVDHPMEAIPQATKNAWDSKMWIKYNARWRKGDIFNVFPDGYSTAFGDGPIRNPILALIRVPGVDHVTLKQYTEMVIEKDINGDDIMRYRRRYGIPISAVPEPMKIITIKLKPQQTALINSFLDKVT